MVVFTNRRLGPSVEMLVSEEIASTILREIAAAARPTATARWEHELVRWLDERAGKLTEIDVGDLAWTPDHFESQRGFVVRAIERAIPESRHEIVLRRWMAMIASHPRESVQVGRRWPQPLVTA